MAAVSMIDDFAEFPFKIEFSLWDIIRQYIQKSRERNVFLPIAKVPKKWYTIYGISMVYAKRAIYR